MPDDATTFTDAERALADELHVDLGLLDAEPGGEEVPEESGGSSATPRRRPLTFGRRL